MVVPQLPLTLGNAVVATSDVARTYFGDKAKRVSPRALTASKGIANIIAGLLGAMPMCHGSGGLTAHYRLGARTGAANLMIGGILLAIGVLFRWEALPILQLIPLSVLGVLLVIIGVYHALLIGDLTAKTDLALAGTVGVVAIITGNLTIGFAAGIVFYHLLKFLKRSGAKASVG
jgi:SulP family sulfate permease